MTLVVALSFHPDAGWRLFTGPGYEITDEKDNSLVRVGGAIIWTAGISVGYTF